jgi:effector-binding domain-containing protein
MLRFWKIFSFVLVIVLALWYFFIKEYDYKITFKSPQATGIIYNSITKWNNWESPKNRSVINKSKAPFSKLIQELHTSESIMDIKWVFENEDSLTKVSAYLSDRGNSFVQRMKVPFIKTAFVQEGLSIVTRIQKDIKELEDRYKIGKVELSSIPEQYCAYISLESSIENKANKMMSNNAYILTYLQESNIEIVGPPFVEVTKWNEETSDLAFNFCFPVSSIENHENFGEIKFKMTEKKPALKTIFNGNYRISDCAWFSIIDYANRNSINIEKIPTEIFYNDPHIGGNALNWKAEIYFPIKSNE